MAFIGKDVVSLSDYPNVDNVGTPGLAPNNTIALRQAVADAAQYQCCLLIRAGTYLIDDTIDLTAFLPGIIGLGNVSLVWAGPANGAMLRLGSKNQYLENITLDGQQGAGPQNGIIGIVQDTAHSNQGNFVQTRLSRVTVRFCDKGIQVTRPNPGAGGQNEGALLNSCLFESNNIGISFEHGNIDYWNYVSTYWVGNKIGILSSYLGVNGSSLSNANNHTFVGCTATSDYSAGTRWIKVVNQNGVGNWAFKECQTERIEYGIEIGGLGGLEFDGGVVTPLYLDQFDGTVTTRNAVVAHDAAVNKGIFVKRGYFNYRSLGGDFFYIVAQKQASFRDWAVAGGVSVDPGNIGPGETFMDKVYFTDLSRPYGVEVSLPLSLSQPRTLGWKHVPTLDVQGNAVGDPLAVFRDGTGVERVIFEADGVVQSTGIRIGKGTTLYKHVSGTAQWAPPQTPDNRTAFTNVAVVGAEVGDTVCVGFSTPLPGGALLTGAVTARDVVTVTLFNKTGRGLGLRPGTLAADVWKDKP